MDVKSNRKNNSLHEYFFYFPDFDVDFFSMKLAMKIFFSFSLLVSYLNIYIVFFYKTLDHLSSMYTHWTRCCITSVVKSLQSDVNISIFLSLFFVTFNFTFEPRELITL